MADDPFSPGKARARRTRLETRAAKTAMPVVATFMEELIIEAKRVFTSQSRLGRGTVTSLWDSVLGDASDVFYTRFEAEAARAFFEALDMAPIPGYAYETTQEILQLARAQNWPEAKTFEAVEMYLDPYRGGPAVAAVSRARDEIPSVALEGRGEGWEAETMRDIRTVTTQVVARQDMAELLRLSIPYKQWVARHDPRTRESHRGADGQVVPLDADFSVGNSHLYMPGDPEAPYEEIVNCRCIVIGSPSHTPY